MTIQLSKSDFKLGLSCPTKLYYKKHQFPTSLEGNEYIEMLADGGYMIGYLAQLLYPTGIEVTGSLENAIETTSLHLQQEDIILFEPVIRFGEMIARIDILVKNGKNLKIIEVKSKSFDSVEAQLFKQKGKNYFGSSWTEYLYDVAYQKVILQNVFPESTIECELLMPDKSKRAEIDSMVSLFQLTSVDESNTFRKPVISFTGTQLDLELIKKYPTLEWINVDNEIKPLLNKCINMANILIEQLKAGERIESPIGLNCKDCEYSATDILHDESGFKLCWGKMAEPKPHILELGQLGNVNKKNGIITDLIKNGKTSLYDVPVTALIKDDGTPYYNNRPLYQITEKEEFLLSGFEGVCSIIQYPLFFIDFETSQMALPYHKGMRCYENVIFQYSCHIIHHKGAEPVHAEWLNTNDSFPNHEFARSLMKVLGTRGTIFIWSKYEITQFKNILRTLVETDEDTDLRLWLETLLNDFEANDGRFIDLNMEATKYYYHPFMGGRTSIKVTLPAVLKSTKSEKIKNWLDKKGLLKFDEDGSIINPYKLLPSMPILEDAFQINVKDGSGAMRAYQDMLYGINKNNEQIKAIYIDCLLFYCFLDTLAMVIIWEHWCGMNQRNI
ncbi:DUF2779 domain-containing protein [Mucilaginibacter terrigena]|uniref:DUF2779 domain-containing protein n=1 Tax=Mucilaginibacter terrigena TaxID=2492395 RepID=A0A4Q5LN99_9SPHI|nr:DUF2779 domain-containing protein [Mucilaginibacter terrigena]RYU90953.1 DUF2779 domain-containing protein [Mucilaginibacter terrigena]